MAHLGLKASDERENGSQLATTLAHLRTSAQIIAQEPDRLSLLKQSAEHLAKRINTEKLYIGLVTNGAIHYDFVVERDTQRPLEQRIIAGQGVAGQALARKKPQTNAPDLFEVGAAAPDYPILAVPALTYQRQVLAVIECHKTRGSLPFTRSEIDLVESVALLLTPGLERAYLFDQMERWTNSFESLLMFNASLNSKLEPLALVKRLVEYAAGFLGAEAGMAGLVRTHDIWTDGYWHDGSWHPLQMQWSPREEDCPPGWVLINQCPYLTNDYGADPLAAPILAEQYGVKNALCIPIMDARETVLGFVELHNKGNGREQFTWSDAHFLESLANSAAISIHNAHLLNALEVERGRLKAFAARNLNLIEDERQRIARELHDEAGQVLIGIKLELQVLARKMAEKDPALKADFDRMRQMVNESTNQIKSIGRALRPPVLDQLGLEIALGRLTSEMQRRAAVQFHFNALNLNNRLPQPIETTCYRLVQEALTNVIRHASANQVWITLDETDDDVYLTVRDDGCGFDPDNQREAGLGLLGMQERVSMLNGVFKLDSTLGVGTTINAIIPIKPHQSADNPEPEVAHSNDLEQ